ncbi:MAG: SDR family oxidoreductase [Actinobacteria bacterium]|nr:SDR family oxidoreductase [Actinomycetota bacterium]
MTDLTNIKDHVILVAGAASGIGYEIAKHLLSVGAIVVTTDKNSDGLTELKNSVNSEKLHVRIVDFLDDNEIEALIQFIEDEVGQLKGVINCVGILGQRGILSEEIDLDNFDLVYRVNLRSALVLSIAAIKVMKPRKYGRILQLASISGKEGNPGLVAYSVTKAGIIAMVKSQGKEYAESGITINALAPALIDTPMVASFTEEQRNFLKAKIPMNRIGDPIEVATLAAWIVSPACSFTTGFAFDLTGGRATY